jgi:hypothetical protein
MGGGIEVVRQKTAPLPLCPPKFPYGLPWDRIPDIRGEKPTADHLSCDADFIATLCRFIVFIVDRFPITREGCILSESFRIQKSQRTESTK